MEAEGVHSFTEHLPPELKLTLGIKRVHFTSLFRSESSLHSERCPVSGRADRRRIEDR